jgi:hypothetical protein
LPPDSLWEGFKISNSNYYVVQTQPLKEVNQKSHLHIHQNYNANNESVYYTAISKLTPFKLTSLQFATPQSKLKVTSLDDSVEITECPLYVNGREMDHSLSF